MSFWLVQVPMGILAWGAICISSLIAIMGIYNDYKWRKEHERYMEEVRAGDKEVE